MTEPRPRVFISSVMEDYGGIRDAANQGIRQAGCEPIRAEDFSAASISPRNACLDGVRSADALVLLLGARYGFVGPSGLAATEEEYEQARRNHKHIFVFLQDSVSREPRQQVFVDKVQNYVDGHWRKVFRDPEHLTELVRDAAKAADMDQEPLYQSQARTRIDAALNRRPPVTQYIVWLQTVWTTSRDEEVIDPLDLGKVAFQRQFQRLSHECEPPLFTYNQSKRVAVETALLRFEQGDFTAWDEAQDLAIVEIHTDGTLVTVQNVTGTEARTNNSEGWFDMYFLDPNVVRARLNQSWSVATAWWKALDPYRRHDPLFYKVAVYDIGTRHFAPVPRHHGSSITIPPESTEDPLVVFDKPRQVARADVDAPDTEINRIVTLLERRFQQWTNRW